MRIELDLDQARVLGVLIEKEATTPDTYPMSLNAITLGCNQKSNREPVLELSETEVQAAIDGLIRHTLVKTQGSAGGRVQRYAHRLGMRLFGEYEFSVQERALLCVLLLRGAQTPGELRTRTTRLHDFGDIGEVERVLSTLATRGDGPHVAELPREPGRRESRWVQLFTGAAPPATTRSHPVVEATAPQRDEEGTRLAALEHRVAALEATVAALRAELGIEEHDSD